MTNEEFQKLVLEKFDKNEEFQKLVLEKFDKIEQKLETIETKIDGIEERVIKNSEFIYNVVQVAKNANVE